MAIQNYPLRRRMSPKCRLLQNIITILADPSNGRVTVDSLWKSYYEESIGTKMNDFDLCLEVESRSCHPLRYIQHSLSRKPLEIEAWFQRTSNRKWHMGYQMVIAISQSKKDIIFKQRGPRPKKVTEGPGWLRYATARSLE